MNFSKKNHELQKNDRKCLSKQAITLILTLFISIATFAQQGINYKAVLKDASGNLLSDTFMNVQFTIHQSIATGTIVYQEDHNYTTDANGLLILNIGTDPSPSVGVFADIDWGADLHFLQTSITYSGSTIDFDATEFMAVPFALHALTSNDGFWIQDEGIIYYNDGDIGIGTNAPLGKLGINHNGSISDPQLYLKEDDNDSARINFKNNNGGNYWTISAYNASNPINERLKFGNGESGDVMSLTGNGKIGFGVTNPKVKFHFAAEQGFLFGTDTIGPGSKIMYIPNKKAFRIGTLLSGGGSVYWDDTSYIDDTSGEIDYVGNYSFATGINNRAQGFGATAMGRDTEASNSYAFASGFFSNADGLYSTAMGFNTIATAEASTAIGKNNTIDANGLFMVGNGTSTNKKNAFTIKEDGKTGINTSDPTSLFEVAHLNSSPINGTPEAQSLSILNKDTNNSWQFHTTDYLNLYQNGVFKGSWNATSGAYVQASDRRVKKDITAIENGTLDKVMQLNPVSYLMKDQTDSNRNLGLISQEVQELFPSLTHYVEESDLLTLSYTELIPILIKALQEQQMFIETQNSKLEAQQSENTTQNQAIQSLLKRMTALETSNNQ